MYGQKIIRQNRVRIALSTLKGVCFVKRILCSLLVALCVALLAGCSGEGPLAKGSETSGEGTVSSSDSVGSISEQSVSDMFTERDSRTEYDKEACIDIVCDGTAISGGGDGVEISGTAVTLTGEGTYRFTGVLTEGRIAVKASETAKLHLILEDFSASSSSSVLYIETADKVFVTLKGGNLLAAGGVSEENGTSLDGAVFSKADLTVNGSGSLTVTSTAGHGIVCKDDFVLTGGTLNITAASHGIQAKDSFRMKEASLTVTAGKDGIHGENSEKEDKGFVYISSGTLTLQAEGDGISASSDLQIQGGTFDILAGGGYENGEKHSSENFGGYPGFPGGGDHGGGPSGGRPGRMVSSDSSADTDTSDATSMKGLKAGNILISGGDITVDSADDALHSNGSLVVKGGKLTLASGDDALHGEDTLTVSGGEISVSSCYEGLEALHIAVSGGNITLKASDDGLNAAGGTDQSGTGGRDEMFGGFGGPGGPGMSSGNGSIVISGGTLHIFASGDGIDANGTLEITGGHTTVTGPTQGDTATLDFDKTAVISGGTFIGTGAAGMAQSFSDSTQGVIALQIREGGSGEITVTDGEGNLLLTHTPTESYQVFIYSSPQIKAGEKYTVQMGALSGETEAN